MISPARITAFQVLERVEQGGFASDLLLAQSTSLSSRDAGLASEIVFGSLRYRAQLDFVAQSAASRPMSELDSPVRTALRMGIYQLRYLDRIPRHAAVSESVDLVKHARKASAAGFVNAVLRKVTRTEPQWPDRARALSHPDWLLSRWDRQFGGKISAQIANAFLAQPETYLHIPPGTSPAGACQTEPTSLPGCVRLVSGDPGQLRIQDISSQSIVPLLDLQPGHKLLDLCAAPGNKTAQAIEQQAWCVASDLHGGRLRPLRRFECPLVQLDGTQSLPFRPVFDRILVDAPCSGTGTLGRNPEIKWRLGASDLPRLADRQRQLLRNALVVLRPGGKLVYSTCSLESTENEEVVQQAIDGTQFEVLKTLRRTPGVDPGDGFYAAVIASKGSVNG